MTPDRGPELFARFAVPPNRSGYCGPLDATLLSEAATAGDLDELRHLAAEFNGAMPYLQLIAASSRTADPLSYPVVEAYWIGNDLLDAIDVAELGWSIRERFDPRAGPRRTKLSAMVEGAQPSHAFHVFCVYPWVGLLREGFAPQPLQVLDDCRISHGEVVDIEGDTAIVMSRPLQFDEPTLRLGPPRIGQVRIPAGWTTPVLPGQELAIHWGMACAVLEPGAVRRLDRQTRIHLDIVNRETRALAATLGR